MQSKKKEIDFSTQFSKNRSTYFYLFVLFLIGIIAVSGAIIFSLPTLLFIASILVGIVISTAIVTTFKIIFDFFSNNKVEIKDDSHDFSDNKSIPTKRSIDPESLTVAVTNDQNIPRVDKHDDKKETDKKKLKVDKKKLEAAALAGKYDEVSVVLKNGHFHAAVNNNSAITSAARKGYLTIVAVLLEDGRFSPDACDAESSPIQEAAAGGHLEVVRYLLNDWRVNPAVNGNAAIKFAAQFGHAKIVSLLLNNMRVAPADNDNAAIKCAVTNGHVEIVVLLLNNIHVYAAANIKELIQLAVTHGHRKVIRALLNNPKAIDLPYKKAIDSAVAEDINLSMIDFLLNNSECVDQSVEDNKAIRWAAKCGHLEVVALLLKDERVDPSAKENEAIRWAAKCGHLEVVALLLKDECVDPSAKENEAIRSAAKCGHLEVVALLLKDERVDPTAKENEAIRSAICSRFHWERNLPMTGLLLTDKRVMAACDAPVVTNYLYVLISQNTQKKAFLDLYKLATCHGLYDDAYISKMQSCIDENEEEPESLLKEKSLLNEVEKQMTQAKEQNFSRYMLFKLITPLSQDIVKEVISPLVIQINDLPPIDPFTDPILNKTK